MSITECGSTVVEKRFTVARNFAGVKRNFTTGGSRSIILINTGCFFLVSLVVQSFLDNHEEALSLRELALSAYIEQLDDHPFTGTLYNYLGNDCLALGNFDKAVEYFSKALSIRQEFLGFYHQETSRTLHDLSVAYKMKVSLSFNVFAISKKEGTKFLG